MQLFLSDGPFTSRFSFRFCSLQNDFFPPEWLPVLQHVVGRIRDNDEDTSVMFELLKTLVEAGGDIVAPHIPHIISVLAEDIQKHIPLSPEQWPQVSTIFYAGSLYL